MEFFHEIFLAAILSLIFAFLIAKLLSMVSDGDTDQQDSSASTSTNKSDGGVVIAEERVLQMKNLRFEPEEERVQFVGEDAKIDEFQADLVQGNLERVQEGCETVEFLEGDQIPVKEEALEDKFVEERRQEKEEEDVKAGDSDLGEFEKGFKSNKEDDLVEERIETGEVSEINRESAEDEEQMPTGEVSESFQGKEIEGREQSRASDEKAGMSCDDDEDDWEGIERSDVEKLFATAAAFVGSLVNNDHRLLSKVGNDVQMQLYALHKVATEGPCHESQPMALMVSARAKWNAWQRLGSMNPEVAMEQYISLLSDSVPGWMGENSRGDGKWDSVEAGISGTKAPDLSTDVRHQHGLETERKPEEHQSAIGGGDAIGDPNSLNRDKL